MLKTIYVNEDVVLYNRNELIGDSSNPELSSAYQRYTLRADTLFGICRLAGVSFDSLSIHDRILRENQLGIRFFEPYELLTIMQKASESPLFESFTEWDSVCIDTWKYILLYKIRLEDL